MKIISNCFWTSYNCFTGTWGSELHELTYPAHQCRCWNSSRPINASKLPIVYLECCFALPPKNTFLFIRVYYLHCLCIAWNNFSIFSFCTYPPLISETVRRRPYRFRQSFSPVPPEPNHGPLLLKTSAELSSDVLPTMVRYQILMRLVPDAIVSAMQ